jgi:hypothetical protein
MSSVSTVYQQHYNTLPLTHHDADRYNDYDAQHLINVEIHFDFEHLYFYFERFRCPLTDY